MAVPKTSPKKVTRRSSPRPRPAPPAPAPSPAPTFTRTVLTHRPGGLIATLMVLMVLMVGAVVAYMVWNNNRTSSVNITVQDGNQNPSPGSQPTYVAPSNPDGSQPPVAGGVPFASAKEAEAAHEQRVRELAVNWPDIASWLSAAGYSYDSLDWQARQPEEETFSNGDIVVSGLQVGVTNMSFVYPTGFTTDKPVNGRCHQPDPNNPSKVCTDVQNFTGTATLWVDVQNWGQLWPTSASTTTETGGSCFSVTELDAKYGIEKNAQGTRNGLLFDGDTLAGAVLHLTKAQATELEQLGWVVQGTNPDVKSAWSPDSCRPLAR